MVQKGRIRMGMVLHIYNYSTQERQKDDVFMTKMSYIASSR